LLFAHTRFSVIADLAIAGAALRISLKSRHYIAIGTGAKHAELHMIARVDGICVRVRAVRYFPQYSHLTLRAYLHNLPARIATALAVWATALTPVMVALALLVRADGGPVLFRQRRIGAGGRPFMCLKYRTMRTDAEAQLQQLLARDPEARASWESDFKLRVDPRITRFGSLLRQTSLDELPQLFNVLKGDMSLVGPRPIVAAEVPRYGRAIREYLNCRPGVTGLWQVSGRNDVDYPTRVKLDQTYARNWSLVADVGILFRTVRVVLLRSGAY
jgi:exopolysaccharide production protein ExoY